MVTQDQVENLYKDLRDYHKSLVSNLISKSKNNQLKTLTHPQLLLGFSDVQITQVLDNCDMIFTLQDILNKVEIWDIKHAASILEMVNKVFGDVLEIDSACISELLSSEPDGLELQYLKGEWDNLIQDDSLLELALENLSISHLEISANETHDFEESLNAEVPATVMDVLDNQSFNTA